MEKLAIFILSIRHERFRLFLGHFMFVRRTAVDVYSGVKMKKKKINILINIITEHNAEHDEVIGSVDAKTLPL